MEMDSGWPEARELGWATEQTLLLQVPLDPAKEALHLESAALSHLANVELECRRPRPMPAQSPVLATFPNHGN
jgi:hypothetical protein